MTSQKNRQKTSQNVANVANVANAIFAIIKIQIDSTSEFYKGVSEKRSEAGRLGNVKRWASQKNEEFPSKSSQNIAKSPETETETEIYKKKIYKRKFFQKKRMMKKHKKTSCEIIQQNV